MDDQGIPTQLGWYALWLRSFRYRTWKPASDLKLLRPLLAVSHDSLRRQSADELGGEVYPVPQVVAFGEASLDTDDAAHRPAGDVKRKRAYTGRPASILVPLV